MLAIVDNGLNITAAAEKLYTSQPGVSKQLKLLEEELGLDLLRVTGRAVLREALAMGDLVAVAGALRTEVRLDRGECCRFVEVEASSVEILGGKTLRRHSP